MAIDPKLCQAEVTKKVYVDPANSTRQEWRARQCQNVRTAMDTDLCSFHLSVQQRQGKRIPKVKP